MRLALVGKGGSGKTTIASLLARLIAEKNLPVLAIDADINQHLAEALGAPAGESRLPPLGIESEKIKEYLRGANVRIRSASSMIKTTPPGSGSRMLKFGERNPIFDYFERKFDGVRLMAVGEFTEEDLGIKCYHSKTGSAELMLNHLIDKEKEYLIVDMTAGADSFASGMFTKFDLTLLVVEPTLKSVSVYGQYQSYAKQYGVNIKAIGNKIESQEDIDFIRRHTGDNAVAFVKRSEYIRSMEKGRHLPISNLEPENRKALETIIASLDSCKKNWKKLYKDAVHFHVKNAESWANAATGEDLTSQVDPSFNIETRII